MHRSAAFLLLALCLGAFVAASADTYELSMTTPNEPPMDKCKMKSCPYPTWGCPTCDPYSDGAVKTECNKKLDGKADITINLKKLFGNRVGFVAVSYTDDGREMCENNQKGDKKEIVLKDVKCGETPTKLKLLVQDKWWFNENGMELDIPRSCYDKCTRGKPCHTCPFEIYAPACKDKCKAPVCPRKRNDEECPELGDECFKKVKYDDYVKVTLKRKCRQKYSHIAFSYMKKKSGDKDCAYFECSSDNDAYSFEAKCDSDFTFFLEDEHYVNTKATYCPVPPMDKCFKKFNPDKFCDQCGPYGPINVGPCKPKEWPIPRKVIDRIG